MNMILYVRLIEVVHEYDCVAMCMCMLCFVDEVSSEYCSCLKDVLTTLRRNSVPNGGRRKHTSCASYIMIGLD